MNSDECRGWIVRRVSPRPPFGPFRSIASVVVGCRCWRRDSRLLLDRRAGGVDGLSAQVVAAARCRRSCRRQSEDVDLLPCDASAAGWASLCTGNRCSRRSWKVVSDSVGDIPRPVGPSSRATVAPLALAGGLLGREMRPLGACATTRPGWKARRSGLLGPSGWATRFPGARCHAGARPGHAV
jgi:hypothetical protein